MKPGCILHEKTQRFLRGRREWHVNLQSKWRPGAFYTRKHNDFSGVGGGLRRGCIIRNRDTVGTLAWHTVHIGTVQYVRSCGTVGKMVRCSRYYGRVVRRRGTLYPTSEPKFWKSSQPISQVSPPILHLWQPILHFSQRIFGYTKVVRWRGTVGAMHCTIVPSYRTTAPYRTWHRTPPYVPYHRTVLHTAPNRTYHKPSLNRRHSRLQRTPPAYLLIQLLVVLVVVPGDLVVSPNIFAISSDGRSNMFSCKSFGFLTVGRADPPSVTAPCYISPDLYTHQMTASMTPCVTTAPS